MNYPPYVTGNEPYFHPNTIDDCPSCGASFDIEKDGFGWGLCDDCSGELASKADKLEAEYLVKINIERNAL